MAAADLRLVDTWLLLWVEPGGGVALSLWASSEPIGLETFSLAVLDGLSSFSSSTEIVQTST